MKAIRILAIASCLSLLSSCGLITSLLKIPASLLKAVGRTAGMGLTDDAPQPVKEGEVIKTVESIEDAAQERQAHSE